MAKVTLICSVHQERGACTVDAMHNILRDVGPAVVFLELRASDLALYEKQLLETRAIHLYSIHSSVETVAVDDFLLPVSLRSEMDSIFSYVEQRSEEFNQLEEQRDSASCFGFEAINSSEFETIVERGERCTEVCIAASGSQELVRWHANWTALHRQREESMLLNIYDFCRKCPDTRGVFLVGAAHLSSLAKGIQKRTAQEPGVVLWEIWNRPGRLSQR
jgi:hypothetical protein